jgi:hypothetical protein
MSDLADSMIARFRDFVARGGELVLATSPTGRLSEFRQFIQVARPLLLHDLPTRLSALRPSLDCIRRWLLPQGYDLLKEAGMTFDENAYTNLMAWSLRPSTHPATALQRQTAWLSALSIPGVDDLQQAADPLVRCRTADGAPDMVLRYDRLVVVIEAKTGTEEHPTPSGAPQSIAYPRAVRHHLGITTDVPVHLIFLTADGTAPASPDGVQATYLGFAAALAAGLAAADLPEDLRHLFRLWITHLATCAVPADLDIRRILTDVLPALAGDVWRAEGALLANLTGINLLARLLPEKATHEHV